MKKDYGWIRFLVQGVLIAVIIVSLLVFFRHFRIAEDDKLLYSYAAVTMAAVFVCSVLIVVSQLLFTGRSSSRVRREREEDLIKLKKKAQTDSLTSLLNREESIEQITRFLGAEGARHSHTLMIIDLDNFKSINDNFGHFEGDKVLKILAAKIKSVFRNIDIVGRFGGDEFIVLMKHTSTKSIVRRKALELRAALEYIASGGSISVTITGSIGISTYDGDGKTFETLYKEADEALYKAKLGGKDKYCYFKETEEQADDNGENIKTALTERGAFIQLQALIDNIDGGIALFEISDELRAIFLSQSYIRLMQVSYAGINEADNRVFDFIHKDDIGQVEETLRQGASTGKPVEAVFRMQTESGEIKWHHIRAVRIEYEDSEKPVLLAIVTDVTNLKMTELNFQAQKRQLETVLRISRVVTFEVDIARRTLYVADPTMTKYGIDVHAIENMPESLIDAGVIHPDSIEECLRMYDEIYSGIPEGSAIIRTLKRDGQFTIERFTYFTVSDDSGRPIKAVGVDEGMEIRSASKLRVDLIERQFRNHADNMLTIIKVVISEDSFEYLKHEDMPEETKANIKTYSDILEYRIMQAIDPVDRLMIKKLFSIDGLQKDSSDRSMLTHEYKIRDSKGAVKWNSMGAGLYVDQFDGNMYAFIRTRDITFKKNMELALNDKIILQPNTNMYTPDTFGKLSDAYIKSPERETDCAIILIKVRNYAYLLEQYGRIMTNDMLVGFVGKILTIIYAEHFACYDEMNTMALLVPDIESNESLRLLIEKIIKLLRNPAYFQFHEEVFMDISCGIAISDDKTDGFAELYDEASRALQSLDEQTDENFNFFKKI